MKSEVYDYPNAIQNSYPPARPEKMEKTDKNYRTWMYYKKDAESEMQGEIFTLAEAEAKFEEGWRQTPAAFANLTGVANSRQMDTVNEVLNQLLNIDEMTDLGLLTAFATDYMGMKVHHKSTLKTLKKRVIEKAIKDGLIEKE